MNKNEYNGWELPFSLNGSDRRNKKTIRDQTHYQAWLDLETTWFGNELTVTARRVGCSWSNRAKYRLSSPHTGDGWIMSEQRPRVCVTWREIITDHVETRDIGAIITTSYVGMATARRWLQDSCRQDTWYHRTLLSTPQRPTDASVLHSTDPVFRHVSSSSSMTFC